MNKSIIPAYVFALIAAMFLNPAALLAADDAEEMDAPLGPPPMLLAQADPVPLPPPDGPRARGDHERDRGGFGDRMKPLSDEEQKNLLEVLADLNPDMKARLEEALKDNPRRAQFVLRRAYDGHIKRLIQLREADREHYDLQVAEHKQRIEIAKLAYQIRKAKENGQEQQVTELTAELRQKMHATFEVRQKLRQKELAELEKRIETMRKELAEHEQQKDKLIDEAMTKVLKGRRGDRPDRREREPMARPEQRD